MDSLIPRTEMVLELICLIIEIAVSLAHRKAAALQRHLGFRAFGDRRDPGAKVICETVMSMGLGTMQARTCSIRLEREIVRVHRLNCAFLDTILAQR